MTQLSSHIYQNIALSIVYLIPIAMMLCISRKRNAFDARQLILIACICLWNSILSLFLGLSYLHITNGDVSAVDILARIALISNLKNGGTNILLCLFVIFIFRKQFNDSPNQSTDKQE